MRLGLMSDTHDNVPMIKEVIRRLNGFDVSLVLHAGDYISPFTAKPYSELKAKMIGVLGNNCAEREKLREVYAAVGKEIVGNFAEIEAGARARGRATPIPTCTWSLRRGCPRARPQGKSGKAGVDAHR